MKAREKGLYCSTAEAAEIIGVSTKRLRQMIAQGKIDIGDVVQHATRTEYRIERDKVLLAAGLAAWPETEAAGRKPAERAQTAAQRMLAAGLAPDTVRSVAYILYHAGVISMPQYRRMIRSGS